MTNNTQLPCIILGAYRSFDAFLTLWLANVHVDTACNSTGAFLARYQKDFMLGLLLQLRKLFSPLQCMCGCPIWLDGPNLQKYPNFLLFYGISAMGLYPYIIIFSVFSQS